MKREPDMLRQLPHQADRVETGPVKFGQDYPGLFIRGDQCLWMASAVKLAQDAAQASGNPLLMNDMNRLADLLGQVDERLMEKAPITPWTKKEGGKQCKS